MLEVLWTGGLEGRPHAAVISQESAYRRSLALGFGEVPTDEEVERPRPRRNATPTKPGANCWATAAPGSGAAAGAGSSAAPTSSSTGSPTWWCAGRDLASLHVLVGDREITRRGPVAVLDALAFGEPGQAPDTVIYGRTAGGEVVAPLTVP